MGVFETDRVFSNRLTNKEIMILSKEQTDATIKCKCGHSVLVPARNDRKVCSWCGEYVFRNKQDEFKYRLGSKLSK